MSTSFINTGALARKPKNEIEKILLGFGSGVVEELERRNTKLAMGMVGVRLLIAHGFVRGVHICFHDGESPQESFRFVIGMSVDRMPLMHLKMERYDWDREQWIENRPKKYEIANADLLEKALVIIRRYLRDANMFRYLDWNSPCL